MSRRFASCNEVSLISYHLSRLRKPDSINCQSAQIAHRNHRRFGSLLLRYKRRNAAARFQAQRIFAFVLAEGPQSGKLAAIFHRAGSEMLRPFLLLVAARSLVVSDRRACLAHLGLDFQV
jgi:hypothetical protein